MKVICTICRESYHPTLGGFSTITCGHSFHTHCLSQWTENKNSCPKCRLKTTSKNVHTLFLDIGDEDAQQELDPEVLNYKVESLSCKLTERDEIIRNLRDKEEKWESQNEGLRKRWLENEALIKQKNSLIQEMTEKITMVTKYATRSSLAEKETAEYKNKLKLYEHIERMLQGKETEIESAVSIHSLSSEESIRNVVTVNTLLKSQTKQLKEDKSVIKDELQNKQIKLRETKKKLSQKEEEVTQLKSDNESLDRENQSLSKKLSAMQKSIISPSGDIKNGFIQRLISESPAPCGVFKKQKVNESFEIALTPEVTKTISKQKHEEKKTESPYLQLASSSILANPGSRSSSSFMNKNPLLGKSSTGMSLKWSAPSVYDGDDFGYDGLGGHSKVDYFPKPSKVVVPKKKPRTINIVSRSTTGVKKSSINKDYLQKPLSEYW